MQRKIIGLLLLSAVLVAATGVYAIADPSDALPTECPSAATGGDLVAERGTAPNVEKSVLTYSPPGALGGAGTLSADLLLAGPSCLGVEYTLTVFNNRTDRRVLTSASTIGDGTTDVVRFTLSVPGGGNSVCVVASTIGTGKPNQTGLIDRAPDGTGVQPFCATVPDSGSGAGGSRFG